jgi:hypothetical protein
MGHFLVIYDRRAGEIIRRGEFETGATALAARFDAEREFRGEPDIEVVVLGADSWDALEKTHARYFKNMRELVAMALERLDRSA